MRARQRIAALVPDTSLPYPLSHTQRTGTNPRKGSRYQLCAALAFVLNKGAHIVWFASDCDLTFLATVCGCIHVPHSNLKRRYLSRTLTFSPRDGGQNCTNGKRHACFSSVISGKRMPIPSLATNGWASSHVCLGRHGVTDCSIFYHSHFSFKFKFMARPSSHSRKRNLDGFFLQPQRDPGTVVTSSLVWVFLRVYVSSSTPIAETTNILLASPANAGTNPLECLCSKPGFPMCMR